MAACALIPMARSAGMWSSFLADLKLACKRGTGASSTVGAQRICSTVAGFPAVGSAG
jgi:hypothetical protein